ncbi:glutaredoxin family protein [Thiolapillus brandeum]|uniref:Glutaredoxin n=1 Tax=Thiolapillus brandeum TaxID=1076588 RepID=A0A7U6GKM2_9GAMM|nr:glutaredoxin domain-containing protein [Thiolapillus brandeum]BAO45269.1 glutaredoxin [Thiolapillus brandeum]
MSIIRWLLGRIILFFDWLTQPKRPAHSPERQEQLDAQTGRLSLYQYAACPFCVKTRRAIRRLGLNIELRDARNDPAFRQELEQQGGKQQVPCLRIENPDGSITWMYESTDIIDYLRKHFS